MSDQVGPESVGASEGFLGWVAYLGAANAGIPLSIIVKNYGWEVRCPPHLNASHSRLFSAYIRLLISIFARPACLGDSCIM